MSAVLAPLRPARGRAAALSAPRARRTVLPRQLGAPTPWERRDAVVSLVLAVLGAVGVGLCWNGASREAAFRDQIGWTVGACAFCGLFALAGAYWVLVGFRRTRQCLRQLNLDAAAVFGISQLEQHTADFTHTGPIPTAAVVTADGMRLAHHADCLLVRGKTLRSVPAAERNAYPPCAMCAS